MKTFITTAEVAQLLGITTVTFARRRDTLEEDMAFPQPMPHALRPRLWRRDQVEHWIAVQGRPRAAEPARPTGANVYLIEEAMRA